MSTELFNPMKEFSADEIVRAFAIVGAVLGKSMVGHTFELPAEVWGDGPGDELLSLKEACVYLDIGATKLRELNRNGVIKGVRVGSHWKFEKLDLDRYKRRLKKE